MKIITRWILRLLLLAIILVLILDNMNSVDFNVFGIYHLHTPLIILLLAFFIIGILVGFMINLISGVASRSSVRELEKEINKLKASISQTNK